MSLFWRIDSTTPPPFTAAPMFDDQGGPFNPNVPDFGGDDNPLKRFFDQLQGQGDNQNQRPKGPRPQGPGGEGRGTDIHPPTLRGAHAVAWARPGEPDSSGDEFHR